MRVACSSQTLVRLQRGQELLSPSCRLVFVYILYKTIIKGLKSIGFCQPSFNFYNGKVLLSVDRSNQQSFPGSSTRTINSEDSPPTNLAILRDPRCQHQHSILCMFFIWTRPVKDKIGPVIETRSNYPACFPQSQVNLPKRSKSGNFGFKYFIKFIKTDGLT